LLIVGGSGPGNTLQAAQQVLSGGGTVLFVIRNVGAATQLGALAGTNNPTITEAEGGGYSMLGQIDFEHPLFAPFADPRFSDFTRIHFWKHRKLDAAALPNARVLARFDNGDPALLEIPKGKGRLLVLTSGWQPGDSQLALSSKFVPLMYSILDQTGGTQPHATQYQVGDDVALTATVAGGPITVEKPDGTRVELKSGETRFPGTEAPGIYTMAAAQPPMRFAVNLDAAESRTAPLAVEGLERLGVPLKTQEVELAKQIEQKRRLHDAELESQQKLWRKLIVAALVVLLVETWLAGWLTRAARLPVPTHT
jgi:hypothetical protein